MIVFWIINLILFIPIGRLFEKNLNYFTGFLFLINRISIVVPIALYIILFLHDLIYNLIDKL